MNDVPPDPADTPTRVIPMVEDRTERIDVVRTEPAEPPAPVDHGPRWGGGWLILLGILAMALAVALVLLAAGAFKSDDNPSPSPTSTLPIQNPPGAASTSVSQPTISTVSTTATTVSTTSTTAPTTTSSLEPTTTSSSDTTSSTTRTTTP